MTAPAVVAATSTASCGAATTPIPAAADGIAALRAAGLRVAFVSNNSSSPVGDVVAKLGRMGIPADARRRVTSAMAAAWLLAALARARARGCSCAAGPGCARRWPTPASSAVDDGPADAVVVGFHRDFDFDGLDRASRAVRDGARFVATNLDPTYPIPGGLIPGAGALVAAVATAAGVARPRSRASPRRRWSASSASATATTGVVVGDRPSTDGALAAALGWPFALVLSGVTAAVAPPGGEAIPDPAPPFVAADLGVLAPRPDRSPAPSTCTRTPAAVTVRRRLDAELVRRGLLGSRRQAVEAIAAGRVRVAGAPRPRRPAWSPPTSPSRSPATRRASCPAGARSSPPRSTASRSTCAGRRALDAGASTGGFTDCLLQAGAAHVVAVDVGRGQLAWSLRDDPRVTVLERTNVRHLEPDDLGGPVDLAVADLSFISLRPSRPRSSRCTHARRRPRAAGQAAVRGRPGPHRQGRRRPRPRGAPGRAPRGARRAARRRARTSSTSMASPLRGADGNVEFLVHCDARRTRARRRPPRRRGAAAVTARRGRAAASVASAWCRTPTATPRRELVAHGDRPSRRARRRGARARVTDGRHRPRHRPTSTS